MEPQMANGIYVAATGSQARLDQLETVSNNLANLMTSGFKRQEAVYREIHNDVAAMSSPDQAMGVRTPNRFLPEDRINVSIDDRYTTWAQGNLDETGNVLDLAIEGQGFFKVRDEAGNILFSRQGQFKLDEEGKLINQAGLEVLDPTDKPIRIPPNQGMLNISYDGFVSVGETQIGRVDLVTFGDGEGSTLNNALSHIGEGLYRHEDQRIPEQKASGLIRQGFVEGSNVNAVMEMMGLLSASRLFDLNQQAVKAMGEMDSQAAKDVALVQG
jgi:flagellar basal-body rod protein FlgG